MTGSVFKHIVDELVMFSNGDTELTEGLAWIDKNVKGDDFYDKVFHVLYKRDLKEKASEWINSKN